MIRKSKASKNFHYLFLGLGFNPPNPEILVPPLYISNSYHDCLAFLVVQQIFGQPIYGWDEH